MARIIHEPDMHDCTEELDAEIGRHITPIGTIAECSCELWYQLADDQRDGRYWKIYQRSRYDPFS